MRVTAKYNTDKNKNKHLIGERFGKWTVIERDTDKVSISFVCKCDCGFIVSKNSANMFAMRNGKSTQCLNCMTGQRTETLLKYVK